MSLRLSLRAALSAAAAVTFALGLCAAGSPKAHADYSETILHTFLGTNGNGDGGYPYGGLTEASDGTLYGATPYGGTAGDGTVFKISTSGTLTVLHNFGDGSVAHDGEYPYDTLTLGSDGYLYATTLEGGASGDGTVFKMTTSGAETILHSFSGGSDGEYPVAAVTINTDGKLYGVTEDSTSGSSAEYGTVFDMKTDGSSYVVQFRFNSGNEAKSGEEPVGTLALVPGSTSNQLYGTTFAGGAGGEGTVFLFRPHPSDGSGTVTLVHSFGDGTVANDGERPEYGRVQTDSSGNIYGDTEEGGADDNGRFTSLHPPEVRPFCTRSGANPTATSRPVA